MTLSQRYSGKFLAPWKDISEWRTTRDLIYGDSIESQKFALDRLKIWKLRTPLMSVGVEGTYILLEALLESEKNLTTYEIAQIYSTALLRFLNICAANNDRQGTFYRTAEKNGLPYWLITLRHDIAHDHKIPAKSLLEAAVKECFKWIKEKYWNIQDSYIEDYVVCDKTNFKDLILSYAQLNLLEFYKQSQDILINNIKKQLSNIIPNSLHVYTTKNILSILEDFLLESINREKIKDSSIQIVSALVDERIILSVNSSNTDGKKIPANFVNIWNKVINLLYVNKTIFLLINKLMDVTEASNFNNQEKEIASLWIAEIYQGLINAEKHKQRIIHKPNEFTMNYLEWVLKFNGNRNDFIKEQCKIVKNLVNFSRSFYTDASKIYSVKDIENLVGKPMTAVEEIHSTINNEKTKFRKLSEADKFRFKGYPLGLCPPNY
ncbi:hypothetical protein WA026_013815 [Henosepilachna vigintioctopunctata]|uniref:Las1-like protein n=1 Tax=Henosepilachna vigintioctopunctata TaxID=420089 RepID=A0AAW1UT03_9CUCU